MLRSTPVLSMLLALSVVGCESAPSKLDGVARSAKIAEGSPTAAPAGGGSTGSSVEGDHSGDTEARLRRLENNYAKYAEALDFLGKVYAQQKAQQAQQEADEPDPTAVFAVDIANDVAAGKVDGPASATVTIVKAFDFACPYCQRSASTMDDLVKSYNGKVRVVYKDMIVHPQIATPAHMAACAAAKQGKYVPFKQAVWEKGFMAYAQARDPSKLGKDNLLSIAKDVGLDTNKLQADMDSDDCKKLVQADMDELAKFKVNSTPTFFINGIHVGGALPEEEFKKIIDERLKVAEAAGVSGEGSYDKLVLANGVHEFRSKAQSAEKQN